MNKKPVIESGSFVEDLAARVKKHPNTVKNWIRVLKIQRCHMMGGNGHLQLAIAKADEKRILALAEWKAMARV